MARVFYRFKAQRDLTDIEAFISHWEPARALSFAQELYQKCENLKDFPEQGTPQEDIGPDIRHLVHDAYRIFYRYDVSKDHVYILRIVEGHLVSSDFRIP